MPCAAQGRGGVGSRRAASGSRRAPALIAGAGTPIGLALARALHRRGVALVGASPALSDVGCRSRLWRSVLGVASLDASAWLETLHAAYLRHGPMVLLAADDGAVRVIAEHAAELAPMYRFVLPDAAVVDRLLDKSVFAAWAEQRGFPVPRTVVVSAPAELRAALRELSFPVMFKPMERTPGWQAVSRRDKVLRFGSAADAERLPFDPFAAADRFVVQEWIPGRDSDVRFCLTYRDRSGRELAVQTGRKITQWPVDIGTSALAVTERDPELRALTRSLLDAAGHVGFGSLEVRRHTGDGRLLITEPTVGRPNMQTGLAHAAGVDLAWVAYRDALGRPPAAEAVTEVARREAIWVHETAFPCSVVAAVRRRRLNARALLGALADLVRLRRRPVGAFASLRDPGPLVLELLRIADRGIGPASAPAPSAGRSAEPPPR